MKCVQCKSEITPEQALEVTRYMVSSRTYGTTYICKRSVRPCFRERWPRASQSHHFSWRPAR